MCRWRCAVPGLSGLISRRFGWYGLVRDRASLVRGGACVPGVMVAQPSARAISCRDSACSSAVSAQEPAGAGEPGRVGLVLGRGQQAGDGLAVDGPGPLDVGAVQRRGVGCAGAAGLAAAGMADGDGAGQGEADLAEGRPGSLPWPGLRWGPVVASALRGQDPASLLRIATCGPACLPRAGVLNVLRFKGGPGDPGARGQRWASWCQCRRAGGGRR